MSIEFKWKIDGYETFPEYDGKKNVVYQCHWRVITDGELPESSYGIANIKYDPNSKFIEFDELTHDIAMDWCKDALGDAVIYDIESSLLGILSARGA